MSISPTFKLLPAFFAACLLAWPAAHAREQLLGSASAKSGMGISAVVGPDAISSYELENRVRFIITMAHMSNTKEVIDRIRPQVVRALIDERLQLQEAERNNIKVSDEEVEQAVAVIEQQRGMAPGTIKKTLEHNRIPTSTFYDQVRAQVAWSRLLLKKVRPQIRISDDEVRLAGKQLLMPAVRKIEELKIAVMQLPVDKPERANEISRLAEKLVGEIRAGASFEEVARQFGISTGGGKLDTFWVRPEQLAPPIAARLREATKGMVTDPVQSTQGYTIVKVYDTRSSQKELPHDAAVAIKEILLKLKPDASVKEANIMLQIGEEVAKNPGSCAEKGIADVDDVEDFDIEVNLYNTMLSELPPAVKVIAENLQVGDISTPFASNEGIRLYMLCDRKDSDGRLDRDRVQALIYQQKMELEAQKYLRDLRRQVYTDVRQ